MKSTGENVILEQLLVADGEQRPTQRREDRQLIVWPLDRHQCGSERLDLVPVVKRLAADEQVFDTACFERLDVGPRNVLTETHEAAEQDADVAGLEWNTRAGRVPLGHRPAALLHEPIDVRAHSVRETALDFTRRDETLTVRRR